MNSNISADNMSAVELRPALGVLNAQTYSLDSGAMQGTCDALRREIKDKDELAFCGWSPVRLPGEARAAP